MKNPKLGPFQGVILKVEVVLSLLGKRYEILPLNIIDRSVKER